MRVLQFGSSMKLFGAERWILALARGSDASRVEHIVMVVRDSPDGAIELVTEADKLGFETAVISASGPFDPRVIFRVAKLVKDRRIDLIHTHGYKSDTIGMLAAKLAGVLIVNSVHGAEITDDTKMKIYLKLATWAQNRSDRVVALSNGVFDYCIATGVRRERLSLIRNGVDMLEVAETAVCPEYVALKKKTKQKLVAYVGRFIHGKGISYLIEAMRQVLETVDTRLLLMGNGYIADDFKRQAAQLGIADSVEFLGFRQDRISIVKACDLFVLPSLAEGIPRVLMEAMAVGTPVISTDIPGVNELVTNGENGLLVPPKDAGRLAGAMTELLQDAARSERLATNAKKCVQEHYSGARMASEYTDLFDKLVKLIKTSCIT